MKGRTYIHFVYIHYSTVPLQYNIYFLLLKLIHLNIIFYYRHCCAMWQCLDCNCKKRRLWVRYPLLGTIYFIYYQLRALTNETRRWAPPPYAHCLKNSTESEERSVLTLGFSRYPAIRKNETKNTFFLIHVWSWLIN